MADNVAVTPGSGATVAADDVGGVLFQRVKATWGPDGTANDTDTALGKALPTQVGMVTLVTLDVKTVTTGGTQVTALATGNRTKGGWIKNPENAAGPLGINEIGTATGTTSSGDTSFIQPGEVYILAPSNNAVSVIAANSGHPFSGMGWK